MITVHFVSSGIDGEATVQSVPAKAGQSLMQAAVAAGVQGIAADCGGMLTCATCHVFVDAAWRDRLVPPDTDEQSMLDFTAAPREANSRLSCQLVLTEALDGLTVRLPATQY
jgi:2Fe-2S ferredoxin